MGTHISLIYIYIYNNGDIYKSDLYKSDNIQMKPPKSRNHPEGGCFASDIKIGR